MKDLQGAASMAWFLRNNRIEFQDRAMINVNEIRESMTH